MNVVFIQHLSSCTVLHGKKFDNKIAQLFCSRNLLWALWLNKWYCTYTNTYKVYLQSTVFFLYFPISVKWLNLLLTLKREFAINCHNLLNGNSRIFFRFWQFFAQIFIRSKLLIKRTAMPIRWMVLSWLIYHMYKNMYNNVQLLPIYMIHTYISFELSFNIQTLPRHTHNQNLIFLYMKILFIFIVIMLCTFLSKKLFICCP